MKILGDFTKVRGLKDSALPKLVRKQRRLEARIAAVAKDLEDEKETREQIDQLLQAAGVQKSEAVLCLGYEVAHNERAGRTAISRELLLRAGVPAIDVDFATETGQPAKFATVKPAKGAKVRAA